MRVVWANGDMKSSEIIAILHAKYHWSDSTVKTLIGRLVKKKALRADRQGRSYIYQSLLDQDRLELAILRERLDGMCQRHHSHLLLALLKERSEEHTSELQSRQYLVCRLLLEKKKKIYSMYQI